MVRGVNRKKHFFVAVMVVFVTLIACAQTPQKVAITDKLLDSLSVYKQLTLQNDLYFKLFAEMYPSTHEAYMGRSVAYNKTGSPSVGFALLNKAVQINPQLNLGYRAFVKLYMMHDYEGALLDCLRLDSITHFAKPGVWGEEMDMVIGLCYLQLNDLPRAHERLTNTLLSVTKAHGKDWVPPRALLYLAITLMKENAYTQAISRFDELIQLCPNFSEAYYYKAVCYKLQKDTKSAEATLTTCRQVFAKFGAEKNPYFELPFQIYASMLSEFSLQN